VVVRGSGEGPVLTLRPHYARPLVESRVLSRPKQSLVKWPLYLLNSILLFLPYLKEPEKVQNKHTKFTKVRLC